MKPLATFLLIVGLLSFICLILIPPGSLITWFIISPLAVATVLFFLIIQLQPVKREEGSKRKWVAIGAIIGLFGPFFLFISFYLKFLTNFWWLTLFLFPFAIIGMDLTFLPSFVIYLIYIGITLLNIGLFALVGLLLGTIVRGITRFTLLYRKPRL